MLSQKTNVDQAALLSPGIQFLDIVSKSKPPLHHCSFKFHEETPAWSICGERAASSRGSQREASQDFEKAWDEWHCHGNGIAHTSLLGKCVFRRVKEASADQSLHGAGITWYISSHTALPEKGGKSFPPTRQLRVRLPTWSSSLEQRTTQPSKAQA